ncbi:self-incompatibility protein S1-like [Papaver somniferum]|uniref:self-incompatibility protein S1-like n=1 Tax=Papaver somniferum TaxID=3469 RepID=UPI000E6FFC8F|nr:self-incompatibility protein S1-like [Papaver somniferum]
MMMNCAATGIITNSNTVSNNNRRNNTSDCNIVIVLQCTIWLIMFLGIAIQAESAGCYRLGKVNVSISNRLRDKKIMRIQCQSADDDLGVQLVRSGETIEWRFGNNIFFSTLFYCDVEWQPLSAAEDGNDCKTGGYHFDAYDFDRDSCRCKRHCRWLITDEGPTRQNDDGSWQDFSFQPQCHSS